jgi:hypothetical protein
MKYANKIIKFLDQLYWPENLKANIMYSTQQDDTDGDTKEGFLHVMFSIDGDAWVSIDDSKLIRFRTWGGGARNHRVRNALLVLAEAIKSGETTHE